MYNAWLCEVETEYSFGFLTLIGTRIPSFQQSFSRFSLVGASFPAKSIEKYRTTGHRLQPPLAP
ncbi:hypothetical protein X798_02459, partial [Onchocerca flexuosa]